MNEDAKNSPAPQENRPAQGQPDRPQKPHSRAKRPAGVKKVTIFLGVCVLGVAAYLIVPEIASSASLEKAQQDLQDVRARLSEAVAARTQAEQALEQTKADLEGAVGRLQVAEADVAAHDALQSPADDQPPTPPSCEPLIVPDRVPTTSGVRRAVP